MFRDIQFNITLLPASNLKVADRVGLYIVYVHLYTFAIFDSQLLYAARCDIGPSSLSQLLQPIKAIFLMWQPFPPPLFDSCMGGLT